MNKHFKIYSVSWLIMFLIFNFVTFMTIGFGYGTEYFNGTFWIAYTLVVLAFAGNFAVTWYATRSSALDKLFLNFSLLRIGYISVVICTIVGTAFMLAAKTAVAWVGAVVAVLVLGFYVLSALRTIMAIGAVEQVERHTEERTRTMRILTVDAQVLVNRASSPEMRRELNKVYEAIRYSDVTTIPELETLDDEIRNAFDALRSAVSDADEELVSEQAKQVITLVEERRVKVKAYK